MKKRVNRFAAAPTLEQILAKYTIAQMSDATGVPRNTLQVNFSRLRRFPGRTPPPELIVKLCTAYGIAPHTLDARLWPNPTWRF